MDGRIRFFGQGVRSSGTIIYDHAHHPNPELASETLTPKKCRKARRPYLTSRHGINYLHTHVNYRVTPVARARRAAQRTYLDGVEGTRREAGDSHGTGFGEEARCLKRTDRVVGAHDSHLYFIELRT